MAVAMIGPKFYAWDKNGKPLAFGKLYTYQARTNVPKDTYQSEDQVVPNTNPVILNGEGYANIYLDGSYKTVLKDSDDNEIWSADPVSSAEVSEWVLCLSATYLSPTSLKVGGNFTEEYEEGRRVRIDNNTTEYSYSTIVSSVFASGETTITIIDPVITTGVVGVCKSVVGLESLPVTPEYIKQKNYVAKKTLAEAIGDKDAYIGKFVIVSDRGNGLFEYVSAETNNNRDKIEATGISATLKLKEDKINSLMLGANNTGSNNVDDIFTLGFSVELLDGDYLVTSVPDINNIYGTGRLLYNGGYIPIPPTENYTQKLNSSIDRFFNGRSVGIEVNRYDPQIIIELNAADTGDANDWSLRESAFIFYEPTRVWYLLCDAVNLDSPYYPNTYDTEIHLFKCTDVESLENWNYLGVAINKGSAGQLGEFGVASCSGAAVWSDGRIYAPFSARNNGAPSFDGRSIGLAYSNSDPEVLPWNKLTNAVVDTFGEDDDPACVFIPGDPRLHVFNRSTAPYRIVHSASLTPRDTNSWSTPNTAISLFSAGTTAIELTSAFVLNGTIHLYGMEQGPGITGTKISDWQSADPDVEFTPANSGDRFISDNEINQPVNLYAGGHFNVAIREGVVRGIFHTYTFGGSRYTLKGNVTVQNPRKELPSPIGLFRARMQGTQSVPSGVSTKVGVVDDLDPYNWFISSRYTPQIEGWYEFEAMVNMVASAAGSQMIVEVRRNNVRVCHLCFLHGSSASAIGGGGKTPPIAMNGTTDYIELFVFQNTGGNVDISGDNTSTYFSGKLIGK